MIDTLVEVLIAAASDDSLRAIHLRGAGDDFCAGADWVASNSGGQRPRTGDLVRRIPHTAAPGDRTRRTRIHLPVVCTVRGWAVGLGCNLALAADFTVAAADAVFWEPFVDRGLQPGLRLDVAAAPAGRDGARQARCCCSARRWTAPTPPTGG